MKVLVESFRAGYDGGISFEKWYVCKLKNGESLRFFDYQANDLRTYRNQMVEMLIFATFTKNINKRLVGNFPSLYRTFIKDYSIPSYWLKYKKDLILN